MPEETKNAIRWAFQQTVENVHGEQIPVSKELPQELVDKMREYFNTHNIEYYTFSYDDLIPYLD